MDTVAVTSMPHPITTFMLGFMLLALVILFIEYRRTKTNFEMYDSSLKRIEESITLVKEDFSKSLNELSKKIDSRVDKAILNIKQKQ
jgi:uncharacterized membrane protein